MNKSKIFSALIGYGLGFGCCALIAVWLVTGENERFADAYAAQNRTIATANETVARLRDTISRVQQNVHANDGVYTVLIDKTGDSESLAELQFINSTANGGVGEDTTRYLRIGRCFVIPGRIVPQSSDGDLGFLYGYINADGSTSGWYTASRAK